MDQDTLGRQSLIAFVGTLLFASVLSGCDGKPRSLAENQPTKLEPEVVTSQSGTTSRYGNDAEKPPTDVVDDPTLSPSMVPEAMETFRPPDDRVAHDDAELERLGIHRVSSRRLILYSDLPKDTIAGLPPLVDALYDDWVQYFGELPPDRLGEEYQITGYLMADEERFRAAGLIVKNLPQIDHGLHLGRRFWMRDQSYDYYREHLLLHEATHCFMTALPDSFGPVWYMEGMAEYIALHQRNAAGELAFGVVPGEPESRMGFDRPELIRADLQANQGLTLNAVAEIAPNAFVEKRLYAWSWAACLFFNHHPHYHERFRELAPPNQRRDFQDRMQETYASDSRRLPIDWALFVNGLEPGYDFQRTALEYPSATALTSASTGECQVTADRGWQATGWHLQSGNTYELSVTGEVVLNPEPKPWRSEPNGISFDYADGRPIGRLVGAILWDEPDAEADPAQGLLTPFDIGATATITPERTGQLYLRVNDHPSDLENNRGEYVVQVQVD